MAGRTAEPLVQVCTVGVSPSKATTAVRSPLAS
jgi:hypothetical protein